MLLYNTKLGGDLMLNKIADYKIVPVVKIDNAEDALPLAEALIEGGLPIAEITFRTDAAERSIREIRKHTGLLVGAGTVNTVDQAKIALDAGANFIVTPGFSRKVTEFVINNNVPIFPGACTPTEILYLMEYDLSIAKFFPAEQYGGLNTIKALSGPFPNIKFMPTGGISEDNIVSYVQFPQIIACGGSWMVKDKLIREHKFDEIIQLTSRAVKLVK